MSEIILEISLTLFAFGCFYFNLRIAGMATLAIFISQFSIKYYKIL